VDIDSIKFSTLGIGFDVLRFRFHLLKSEELPNGRIQPYVSAGPAIFITEVSDSTNFAPANQDAKHTSVGVKAGAGVHVQLPWALSVFGEYRFTHFTPEAQFQDTTFLVSQETLKTNLNTHHLVGGIAFHF